MKYRPMGVVLSLLFMLLFVGALGLRIWASGKSAETVGPDHIAVGQDRVYVHVNGELFVLSAAGKLLAREKIEPLIQADSLIDLRVMSDGRVLLARQQPAGLDLCDPASWRCTPLARDARDGRLAATSAPYGIAAKPATVSPRQRAMPRRCFHQDEQLTSIWRAQSGGAAT